jgi:tetratricopeptide (TPR) repeat protein
MNQEAGAASLLAWPWLLCFYLRISVWPATLSPLYDPLHVKATTELSFLLPMLCLLFLGCFLWRWTRKQASRLPVFCAAWFVITLGPALVVSGLALPTEAFHDRYLYLPLFGIALFVGSLLRSGLGAGSRLRTGSAAAAGIVLCAALAIVTHRQLQFWRSNYALFERASTVAPKNEIANLNFAAELVKTTEYQKALQFSRRAILQNPQSARALGSAAAAAFYSGDYRSAEAHYARAVEIDPSKGNLLLFLGLTRMKLGMHKQARQALLQACAAEPELRGAHYALGVIEAGSGNWQQARKQFMLELQVDPNSSAARSALAEADAQIRKQHQTPVPSLPVRRNSSENHSRFSK